MNYSKDVLKKAFEATCKKRGTTFDIDRIHSLLDQIKASEDLAVEWGYYVKKNYYVENGQWDDVVGFVCSFIDDLMG